MLILANHVALIENLLAEKGILERNINVIRGAHTILFYCASKNKGIPGWIHADTLLRAQNVQLKSCKVSTRDAQCAEHLGLWLYSVQQISMHAGSRAGVRPYGK